MEIFQVIQETITKPPIPHEPQKQSLKAWAMYCLRDKGFTVVYAQNADFAIERKARLSSASAPAPRMAANASTAF